MTYNDEAMEDIPRKIVYQGALFQVEHMPVPGRKQPYEFVRRMGAVTMLPIIDSDGGPLALTVENRRYHYGNSRGLPGGNVDLLPGLTVCEHPGMTAIRELKEEVGYGYALPGHRDLSLFSLRTVSNTIDYPRYFAVMRHVVPVGGVIDSEREKVIAQPMPLAEYVDPLFSLQRGETYPEINAAFAKAEKEMGAAAVLQWLIDDSHKADIEAAFDPWLLALQPDEFSAPQG